MLWAPCFQSVLQSPVLWNLAHAPFSAESSCIYFLLILLTGTLFLISILVVVTVWLSSLSCSTSSHRTRFSLAHFLFNLLCQPRNNRKWFHWPYIFLLHSMFHTVQFIQTILLWIGLYWNCSRTTNSSWKPANKKVKKQLYNLIGECICVVLSWTVVFPVTSYFRLCLWFDN